MQGVEGGWQRGTALGCMQSALRGLAFLGRGSTLKPACRPPAPSPGIPAGSGVTNVAVQSGKEKLAVSFDAPALITAWDTFGYKLYSIGLGTPQVGDADGYVLER